MTSFMRHTYLFSLLLSPLFLACGDSPQISTSTPIPGPGPSVRPEVTDYYVSPASTGCMMSVHAGEALGLMGYVGHGYDVTGDYLADSSVRGSVIDVAHMPDDRFTVFAAPASNSGEVYGGKNAGEFLSSLMANVGEDPTSANSDYYFTGTLGAASANSAYYMSTQWWRAQIGSFPALRASMLRYLSKEFEADLQTLSADEIVEKYGTHFISRAIVGNAVRWLYSAYVPLTGSNMPISVERGFATVRNTMLGSGMTLDAMQKQLASLENYGAVMSVSFSGGDTSVVEFDPETGLVTGVDAWWETDDASRYALISFGDNGLHPLSEAIPNEAMRYAVDQAAARHIKAAQKKLDKVVPLFQNSNGTIYRYVTSASESSRLAEQGITAHGVLGALSSVRTERTSLPLYTMTDASGNQILSLIQPDDSWSCLGYVYPSRNSESVSLYEITDGSRYAYTIEASNSYGPRKEWHPTGVVFYLLRP